MKYVVIALSGKPRRFHGLLHSIAMEISPGTFIAADFDRAAFERIWSVLSEWHSGWADGWLVCVLPNKTARHPPEIRVLGLAPRTLTEQDGIHLLEVARKLD